VFGWMGVYFFLLVGDKTKRKAADRVRQ